LLREDLPFSTDERVAAGLAVRTTQDGTFRLCCSQDAQTEDGIFLAARAEGFVIGFSQRIALTAGAAIPESVEIVLPESQEISGRVQGQDESPVRDALVRAVSEEGGEIYRASARTDDAGEFRVGPLPADGLAALTVEAEGFPETTLTKIPTGGKPVLAVLDRGGVLKGIVQSSASGEPLPEFRIILQPSGSSKYRIRTLLGRDGSFAIRGLPAGSWDLIVSADGFETRTLKGINVADGREADGLTVNLKRITEISGRVFVAESGEPLAGVLVRPVLRYPDGLLRARPEKTEDTGPDGRFAIKGLAPGSYLLDIFRESPPILWRHGALRLDPGGVVAEVSIPVGGEKAGGLDIAVLDPDGMPCVNASAEVVPAADSTLPGSDRFGTFRTGADGMISLPRLVPGFKTVTITLEGNANTGSFPFRKKQRIRVDSGETAALSVSFEPFTLCRVLGTITRGSVPVGEGRVRAVPVDEGIPDLDSARYAGLDSSGRYEFAGLPGGWYLFTLVSDGTVPLGRKPVSVPSDLKELRLDFDLATGHIAGIVVDKATGHPVSKASVFLYALSRAALSNTAPTSAEGKATGVQVSAATAGTDGSFSFRSLEAGEYLLSAIGGERVGHLEKIQIKAGVPLKDLKIALESSGGLNVLVQDEKRKLLEGVMVWAEKTGVDVITPPRRGLTLSSGSGPTRFHPLEPGEYRIVVGAPGRISHVEPALKVEPGKTATITAVLSKGAQIVLTVKDKGGAPVKRCRLAVFAADGHWVGPPVRLSLIAQGEFSDSAGKYSLGGYAPGAYRAHVLAEGFKPRSVSFNIPEKGTPPPINLTLMPEP
jgi:hypothetical protein